MTRLFSRSFGLSLLIAGVVISFVLVLFLIIAQILGPATVLEGIKCHAGISEDCLMADLQREREALAAVRERTDELEALYARLQDLDYAASSFVIFYYDNLEGNQVESGHEYASLVDPTTVTSAWCYLKRDVGASTNLLRLANMNSAFDLAEIQYTDRDLRDAGWTRQDFTQGLEKCVWPGGGS